MLTVPVGQDFNAANFERAFTAVGELGMNEVRGRVGAQLWGGGETIDGDHWEELHHTKLLGVAQRAQSLHDTPPLTGYRLQGAVYAGLVKYHIAYQMLKEAVEDELYGISLQQVRSMGEIMEETHELTYHEPYNNGLTFVSGWQRTPMFANNLRIIGDSAYQASNIIMNAGGPSYHAIALIDQYGENFVTQENRPSARRPVMLVTGSTTAREWSMYYNTTANIESARPNAPAPTNTGVPNIVASNRMANPRDTWVFYEGWEDMFQSKQKYRGKQRSYDIASPESVVHEIASRYLFFFRDPRYVALIPGAG